MEDYEKLLENLKEERERIKDEIEILNDDIFKYQNRGDRSSVANCIEKKGYLKADLSSIENEISRLTRIIKNDGVDPYAPVPVSNSSINENSNLSIDEGTIKTTMSIDVEFNGTKGQGDSRQSIHQTHSQIVERESEIRNGQVVHQQSSVETESSRQTIRNKPYNLIGSSPQKIWKPKQSPKKTSNFITNNEIREKKKMELFISNFKKGKTWEEAAKFSQISPRKASKWYRQGKKNFSNNTRFFYKQIKYLETHGIKGNDEVKSERNKPKTFSNNVKRNERKKMDSFINYLKKGYSWEESAELSKVHSTQAITWYRWGFNNYNENTSYFYNQLMKLNISPNLIDTSNISESTESTNPEIIDVEVVKEIVDEKETIIDDEDLIDDKKSKMNLIIFNLKEGKSLERTSEIVGISIGIINNWIIKGKKGLIEYVDFYNQYKLLENNIPMEYFNSAKKVNNDKLEHSIEKRIEKMDLIHKDFSRVKSLTKNIDERISPDEFKSRLQDFISKFKSKKQEKEKEFQINNKIVSSYGYIGCVTHEDYHYKKIQIKDELNKIDDEIRDAGLRNKNALVISLQHKKAGYKTQLLEIDNIIILLSKEKSLEKDIDEINDKIVELKNKLRDIQDERNQMDEFLNVYRGVKSCRKAASLAGIKNQKIVNWIHEGREGTNANKIYFFKEFNKIKDENERIRRGEELRKLKTQQISQILVQLRNGKTKSEACNASGVNITTFNRWYDDGKNGCGDENVDFYMQVREIKKMNKVLDEYEKSKSIHKSINNSNISNNQFKSWISDGEQGKSNNTIYFYEKFQKIKSLQSSTNSKSNGNITKDKPEVKYYEPKTSFEKKQRENMVNIISEIKKGSSSFEAAEKFNIPTYTIKKWYNQGKEGYSDNTVYFYKQMQIENQKEFNKMGRVLDALNNGNNKYAACEIADVSVSKLNSWLMQGRSGKNKNAEYFVKEFDKINKVDDAKFENENFIFCPNCGKLIDFNQNYCNFCGYRLKVIKKKKRSIFDKFKGLF